MMHESTGGRSSASLFRHPSLSSSGETQTRKLSLRDMAQDLEDISASPLLCIEHEKMGDVEMVLRICDWLQVAPQAFIKNTDKMPEQEMTTPERIEVVLRTDRTLPPGSADALIVLLKVTYNHLSRSAHAQTQVSAPGTHT